MVENINYRCPECLGESEVPVYNLINVSSDPDLKDRVKDGSLFVWECPYCGRKSLLRSPVLYHDPGNHLMLWYQGRGSADITAVKSLFTGEDMLKDYTARVVDSIGELMEKVKIFDAGLDDVTMELVKYVTTMEMKLDIDTMKFVGFCSSDGEITLTYPKDGEMEMIAVGFNVYSDCSGIVARNPILKEKSSGLVTVNRLWVSQFFR